MKCTEVITTFLSALKLFKMFHYFNLVCLKDSLVVGFQGNTATKPVRTLRKNFVRAHFGFAANYCLVTPACYYKSLVSDKKSPICDGKFCPCSWMHSSEYWSGGSFFFFFILLVQILLLAVMKHSLPVHSSC